MMKQCILCDGKIVVGCKSLVYRCLCKVLIFHVFPFEGRSTRKYALDFRGRTENSDGKTATCLQFESAPVGFIRTETANTYSGMKTQVFNIISIHTDFLLVPVISPFSNFYDLKFGGNKKYIYLCNRKQETRLRSSTE